MPNSDFNGDGRDDILWRSTSGNLTNWLAQPGGGFVSNDANAWLSGLPPGVLPILGTGDFNGDNRDDVLWRIADESVSISNGMENGGLSHDDPMLGAPDLTNWFVAGIGDFNGDGRDDVLWRHVGGAVTNWLAHSGFGSDWQYAFAGNDANAWNIVPTNWTVVGVGDFNGDGRDDVLWRRDDGALTNWLGQENGGFVSNDANAWHDIPTNWRVITTGDYDGDGRDDVLWRRDDGALTNWLGQEDGGFVSNDANAWSDVPGFWIIQPNPSGAGEWDY
jgi:hypothetical protein